MLTLASANELYKFYLPLESATPILLEIVDF